MMNAADHARWWPWCQGIACLDNNRGDDMSNEQAWIERLRRAASNYEADAEAYRQSMEEAKAWMDNALRDRDGCLDAITELIEARAKVEELANG